MKLFLVAVKETDLELLILLNQLLLLYLYTQFAFKFMRLHRNLLIKALVSAHRLNPKAQFLACAFLKDETDASSLLGHYVVA